MLKKKQDHRKIRKRDLTCRFNLLLDNNVDMALTLGFIALMYFGACRESLYCKKNYNERYNVVYSIMVLSLQPKNIITLAL